MEKNEKISMSGIKIIYIEILFSQECTESINSNSAGLSQILCKHRNAVQIEQNLFKAEVAQAAAALFSK